MQLTSFTKTLLGVGAGLAVVGGGVGLVVARNQRKGAEEDAYRATPVTVDQFVDKAITAYDQAAYPSPIEPLDTRSDAFARQDGKLTLGAEDRLHGDRQLYPELVGDRPRDAYSFVTGREFLRSADANADGTVTRDELVAAVTPFAGDDGTLDESERRRVLVEGKLGVYVDERDQKPITGWNGNVIATAYEAARDVLGHHLEDDGLEDDGSAAVRISDEKPDIRWTDGGRKLATGPITSLQPAMARIDAEGNGNGLLSYREVATWLAKHHADPELMPGHIRRPEAGFGSLLEPQQIARVDSRTLDGHVYHSTNVPKADVDRFYAGDIPTYLDSMPKFQAYRGGAEWEPDPQA